jgi:hypothetical protein
MNLPRLSLEFDLPELRRTLPKILQALEQADAQNVKLQTNIELPKTFRLILTGDDDVRYAIEVVAGVVTATAV